MTVEATLPLRRAAGFLLGALADTGSYGRSLLGDTAGSARARLEGWADSVVRSLVLRVVDTLVSSVDLTDLVRRHVDLDALAGEIDVAALVRRVDLDDVVARVDLDAAAGRLDLDALAARIDPDRVVARVDLDAAIARIDVVALAREVIEGVDLPEIVRSSTGTMATDAVRTVRSETRRADDAVASFVDRLLRRSPPGGVPVLP